jgi:DNA-3-methyladenine glycosylase II
LVAENGLTDDETGNIWQRQCLLCLQEVQTKLKHVNNFKLSVLRPFDFQLTVVKPAGWHWSSPMEIFKDGVLWTGLYLGNQPVGLKLSSNNDGVDISAYAQSTLTPTEKALLRDNISDGLGAEIDLPAFYEFAKHDPILSITVNDLYGMMPSRLDDVPGRLILAILLQMAPVKRSRQMMDAVLTYYGLKITFDSKEIILWPLPDVIVKTGEAELRKTAKLGYRAQRLVKASEFLVSHQLDLRSLRALPEEDALRTLMEIPGIGRYSASLILGRSSAPLDVWSVVIMSELVLGRTPTNPRLEIGEVAAQIDKRWGKWGWVAFVYVMNDLENLTKKFKLSRLE